MKQLRTYIKQKKADDNIIPPIKSDGALHQDSVDKADILNKQFQMAFSSKSENNPAKQAIPSGVFIEVRNNHLKQCQRLT